ncbi:Alkylsuccinate synthase (II), putative gamma subunit (AssC2) [Desulfatibacillum aliphaticivorans]|uniref:Alkylsuccinate synthase (II), putative gamma subunit (AssC2) n=1 Tax=Desulfatibacillum aliphaticivorans TaxID=218208 RepID=B8FF74_DESAL|nr:benzylsuccinate synthase gamma subunit family protein [Desulfatibacillum aliphaticivorans]ACL03891.1 Alkylsuccinate synthase (II), putative gamma subunit (AssC2) [Desulfatibacillum aliphaticivorans]
MSTCSDCKSFFPREDEPGKGDCVRRVVDPRQAYYTTRPKNPEDDASGCGEFQKR